MSNTTLFKGNLVHLSGTEIKVADMAPEVTVVTTDLADKKVGGKKDKAQLLIVVPSLDTSVCALEAKKFHEKVALLEGVDVTIISMDLPFASKRFCSTEGIEKITVASDFRNKDFAKNYGVLMADGLLAGLTCRAVFIINKEGKVSYMQIVPEVTQEPDYEKCLETLKHV